MKLDLFDTIGIKYYEACVVDNGQKFLLEDFFTTKKEAIDAVKECKKKYKGEKELDCFVRLHDKNGFGINDINL